MKRYAFFYHDSLTTIIQHVGYRDRLSVEQHSFPESTTNGDVVARARKDECTEQGVGATPFGFNGYFTRKLIRVLEIARELSLPPAE